MFSYTKDPCQPPIGKSILCDFHRRRLTPSQRRRARLWLKGIVCKRSYDPDKGMYQCFHCGDWFTEAEICPDHFPMTKGADPKSQWDPDKCVPCCKACNTSGNENRKDPNDYL